MAIDEADTSDSQQSEAEESEESEKSENVEELPPDDDDAAALPSDEDEPSALPPGEDEPEDSEAGDTDSDESEDEQDAGSEDTPPSVGEYTWREFLEEHGHPEDIDVLYPPIDEDEDEQSGGLLGGDDDTAPEPRAPTPERWERVGFDPESYLGFHPTETDERIAHGGGRGKGVWEIFWSYANPETTPVRKGEYTWEHFKWEFYYDEDGNRPRDAEGEIVRFDPVDHLGFEPDDVEGALSDGGNIAEKLSEVVDRRTVDIHDDVDEEEFFSTEDGHTTITNRYDLEKSVPMGKKLHFVEEDRYWVNEPVAFVVIFHSRKENEKKYYLIEPYLNEIEEDIKDFIGGKLRTAIKYSDDEVVVDGEEGNRGDVIEREMRQLLRRYDLHEGGDDDTDLGLLDRIKKLLGHDDPEEGDDGALKGLSARPEPALLADDPETLSEYQIEKLLYYLKRDFIGYERIDGIKHDINVEDVSCDGYDSPVFVYHGDYEQIISNVYHGEEELDDFVVKLAQRSGKGISKRRPQVDATLPDGSRAQLTLGKEVSDHGTNYTIRQFKDVPFTPIDLINWNTFSLEEMAFLWLCIENHKSLIFAGGTASGKTTSLNAVSLFIPSGAKIVSIEDTREVELPQRNWVASVTRPSFSDDDEGDVDEFDLLEAALRQRPDYIVMGEIRGEEGRTAFQVMSTGHTTYTTFHADSVGEVLKRFTTDPINVSKTMFTALDLVSIQTQTRVQGHKVRRNNVLTEVNHYDAENDEINVQDVYQWQAETDEFLKMGTSNTLETIKFDRGWKQRELEEELFKRRVILAYLIKNRLSEYSKVAATVQAFINDPETILTLIANGQLERSLEDLRSMESVMIDVDQEKEDQVPRPEPGDEVEDLAIDILNRAEDRLLEQFKGETPDGLETALSEPAEEPDEQPSIPTDPDHEHVEDIEFAGELADDEVEPGEFEMDGESSSPYGSETPADTYDDSEIVTAETDVPESYDSAPDWLTDTDETRNMLVSDEDEADEQPELPDGTADDEDTTQPELSDGTADESDEEGSPDTAREDEASDADDPGGTEDSTADAVDPERSAEAAERAAEAAERAAEAVEQAAEVTAAPPPDSGHRTAERPETVEPSESNSDTERTDPDSDSAVEDGPSDSADDGHRSDEPETSAESDGRGEDEAQNGDEAQNVDESESDGVVFEDSSDRADADDDGEIAAASDGADSVSNDGKTDGTGDPAPDTEDDETGGFAFGETEGASDDESEDESSGEEIGGFEFGETDDEESDDGFFDDEELRFDDDESGFEGITIEDDGDEDES